MPIDANNFHHLLADCEKCFGLCCVALWFSASEGFPHEKEAGQPCINLLPNHRCSAYGSQAATVSRSSCALGLVHE